MTDTSTPKTIVSLTPLSLDRDSRTLKIAASIKKLGYRSVVVENLPSSQKDFSIPIEIVSLAAPGKGRTSSNQDAFQSEGNTRLPHWLGERIHFLLFLILYFVVRPFQGIFQVPKASLFYLHEYRLFPMVYLLSKLHGTPYIYDAHDYYPLVFNEKTLSSFWCKRFLPLLCWMEKHCIANASRVVTVNQGIANLYRENYGCDPIILKNSHDPRLDTDVNIGIREALSLAPDDFLIVAVGHNKEGLAINNLIEAVRLSSPQVHVAFIGSGFGPVARSMEMDEASKRIHFIPPLPPTEIVPFIKGANTSAILYFAMTEDYEYSLPNKFFQSIAAGLPLFYPPLAEISRIAEEYSLGIEIDPLDISTITKAIHLLENDDGKSSQYSSNAERASCELKWENEEKYLSKILI